MNKTSVYFSAITIILCLTQCNKEKIETEFESAKEVSQIENDIFRTYDVVEDYLTGFFNNGSGILKGKGSLVFLDQPIIIFGSGISGRIDFDSVRTKKTEGITGKDYINRLGIIYFSVDRPYNMDSSILTISLPDSSYFYIGNEEKVYRLTGKITVISSITEGNIIRRLNISDFKSNYGKGEINYSGNWEINSMNTKDTGLWKNQIEITGSGSGFLQNDRQFSINTTEPLKRVFNDNCTPVFIKGRQKFQTDNFAKSSEILYSPFGEENCDWLVKMENGKKEYFFYIR